jgi:hypothetical protein
VHLEACLCPSQLHSVGVGDSYLSSCLKSRRFGLCETKNGLERPSHADVMIMGCQNSPVPLGCTMSSEGVVAGKVKGEIKEGGEVEQSSRCGD